MKKVIKKYVVVRKPEETSRALVNRSVKKDREQINKYTSYYNLFKDLEQNNG